MMKLMVALGLVVTTFPSCVKGDKKKTDYKIEASASNLVNIVYTTRDHGTKQLSGYNQPTFTLEWTGYNKNNISILGESDNGTSVAVKIYEDGKLVADKSGTGNATAEYEN